MNSKTMSRAVSATKSPRIGGAMKPTRNEAANAAAAAVELKAPTDRTAQTEEERRRHMEEVRGRENEKRQHVEERKRAILAAEKQRRESILRKSLERDTKLELKRREGASVGFAFGSSTPRLLSGAADSGGAAPTPSGPCARRRSASMSNADSTINARRSAAREFGTLTTKKRTVSTSGSVADKVTAGKSSSNAQPARAPNPQTTTPKRKTNLMSTSLIVTSSFSSYSSTPRAPVAVRSVKSATKSEPKPTTAPATTKTTPKTAPKTAPKTLSFSRISKSVENAASAMTKSAIAAYTPPKAAAAHSIKTSSERKPSSRRESGNSLMTTSLIASNKITTEEEAIAALAERRRLKREEAERAALEAELRRRAAEAKENERKLREESMRLAEEQQRAAAEQLQKAFEEAKKREEAEGRAKKEAAMLKQLEVAAERLRLEEKERKERRKRVEEIMSRMRKAVGSESKDNAAADEEPPQAKQPQPQPQSPTDVNTHAKYNVNSTGILIVRESNFNFLRS